MSRFILFLLIMVFAAAVLIPGEIASTARLSDKPTVDEIVGKHLDSIGSAKARAAISSRVLGGTSQVTFRSRGIAQANGAAVLASEGPKSMVTMKFESSQYPYENIGFDGSKVTAYQLDPGDYSSLGSFARANPEIFKAGLISGALSSAWPLLDLSTMKGKLEYAGAKKIGARQAIEIKYIPRGGSDLRISLFFDAETFQHVRTVYKKEMSAQMSQGGLGSRSPGIDRTGETSASHTATTYELVEEFSDFETEGGLVLPHTYKIHFAQQGSATQISDWVIRLVRFAFNQHLDARDFDVSSD